MENPVDRTLNSWLPAAAGFLAAASLILWIAPYPPRVETLAGVLLLYATAVAQVLLVAGVSAGAALAAWLVIRIIQRRNPPPPRLVWGIASRAVWVVPLYLFVAVKSGWALIVAALLMLGLVYVLRNLQQATPPRPALSSGWHVFSCVVAGAAIEGGLIAAGAERTRQAVPIIALGTLIVAWHATKGGRSGHAARGLITVFLAIVFTSAALVWRAGVRGGDGFLGFPVDPAIVASLDALQKTFGGGVPTAFSPSRVAAAKERGNADVNVAGTPHRGIYLWPEVKKEVTLVPPLPNLGRMAFGKDHKTPLTIPFYGVYWFFRPPYQQPPIGSLEMHGSPAVRQFVSNDSSPLWEEAHQNLQSSFDLRCCNRVEIDVTNADRQADLVEIGLSLVDSSNRGRLIQPLGIKRMLTKPTETSVLETLSYSIPPMAKIKKMDELIVRFRLVWPRSAESAQVAIERFRLVPKGGR